MSDPYYPEGLENHPAAPYNTPDDIDPEIAEVLGLNDEEENFFDDDADDLDDPYPPYPRGMEE